MNYTQITELIKTGEGYTVEFKESFSSSIGKEICAFANAQGGKILLGVKDNNKIKGFKLTNKVSSQIQAIINNIDPKLNVTIDLVKDIGVIGVPEGEEKPYAINSEFYLRQGANSQKITRDEILEFFRNSNKISFEKQINKNFNLEKDFDEHKFNDFITKANISKNLTINHILKNLGLLTNNIPNNACTLLFPHKVTKFFLSGDISCVLYQGDSKAVMLDKKVFDADFISNFENAVLFILRNTRTKADIINLRRVETPEISEKALREVIINAMIHKDYFIEGRILIEIFSNSVKIGNPGKLLFDSKELGEVSILRNPILADCILRTELIEKIGSGIGRIKELAPNVKFEISENWFRVVFNREAKEDDTTPQTTPQTKLESEILALIKENNILSRKEIADKLDKGEDTIKEYLAKLKRKGLLKRHGTYKGYWEVIEC